MRATKHSSGDALVWQLVHWPIPMDSAQALGLLTRLAADQNRGPILWEVQARAGQVTHRVAASAHQIRAVVAVIESHCPGASISMDDEPRPTFPRSARLTMQRQMLSLVADDATQTSRTVLGALAAAKHKHEHALVQIVLGASTPPRAPSRSVSDPTQSLVSRALSGTRDPSSTILKSIRAKEERHLVGVGVRVAASANSEGRRLSILHGLLAAFRTIQAPGTSLDLVGTHGSAIEDLPRRAALQLSPHELLGLMAWPLESENMPGMPSPHPKMLRMGWTDIETERVFGETASVGDDRVVGISGEDSLFHTVTTAPTGSGKSTVILNFAIKDAEAGRGLVIVDPKSDMIRDFLSRVPAHRADDVVLLDPTQLNPVGLNPLAVPGTSPELIADGILEIFRDLYPGAFGPRTTDIMHASLLTLAQSSGATLAWLPRLLTDGQFRRSLVDSLQDPDGLEAFWESYNQMGERQQAQHIGPVLSRLRQFLLRPGLKRVIDQSVPRFALEDVFTKQKILLVPLNVGLLGNDAARLLGSLLVTQLWQLTLARAARPKNQRPLVSIVIDEVQEFIRLGNDLSDALARSRSLGVSWSLAHQYRDQLSPAIRSAIDTNCRNKLIYALDVKDARDMAAMAPELVTEDFMKLPQYHVYARLMRKGQQMQWVSAKTNPLPPESVNPQEIIDRSIEQYGRLPEDGPGQSFPTAPSAPSMPPKATSQSAAIGRRKRAK